MGRSQETFSKKEKEKARHKKRQDKEQKKEERKANASKGQGLDMMLAYVDENGNLTTTPPDPRNKKTIDAGSISIGVDRQDATPSVAERKGVVTTWLDTKGYGFIKDTQSQQSIFVHKNGLIDDIRQQDKVSFQIETTPKGPNAVEVRKIG
nr:cold shock domain-containing protein [uncultured Arsenicibacter sp.]